MGDMRGNSISKKLRETDSFKKVSCKRMIKRDVYNQRLQERKRDRCA